MTADSGDGSGAGSPSCWCGSRCNPPLRGLHPKWRDVSASGNILDGAIRRLAAAFKAGVYCG